MATIYPDNLAHSRSGAFRGIAGRSAAMQEITRDRKDIKCHICGRVGHFKSKCPLCFMHQQQDDGQKPQQREEHQNNPRRQHQRNSGGGRGPVWCSYHKTTTHSDANCRVRRRKRADGNAHIAATGPSRVKGSCSVCDLPEEDDQPERPHISFTATEVHPTAAIAPEQSHKAETWPFGSLSASRPWPFDERAKPAISFVGQEKPDFYMYGGTDGEGEPRYSTTPMESEPSEIERTPHASNPFRIWNLNTRRNVVLIETPPHLLPPSRRLPPQQGLEAPTFDFSDNGLDDNYTSREDMIQDVQDHTSALDFDAGDPT